MTLANLFQSLAHGGPQKYVHIKWQKTLAVNSFALFQHRNLKFTITSSKLINLNVTVMIPRVLVYFA